MIDRLKSELRRQLEQIEPSVFLDGVHYHIHWYPGSIEKRDGTVVECVHLVSLSSFQQLHRRPPAEVSGLSYVSPNEIRAIRTSRFRLPARFANEIYRVGESGPNYFGFRLEFSFWRHRDYCVVGPVDFLYYPRWMGPGDIKGLGLSVRQRRVSLVPPSSWCVFEE
jgi:hypothetical protein